MKAVKFGCLVVLTMLPGISTVFSIKKHVPDNVIKAYYREYTDTTLTAAQKDSILRLPLDIDSILYKLEKNKPDLSYLDPNPLYYKTSPFFYELKYNGYYTIADSLLSDKPVLDYLAEEQRKRLSGYFTFCESFPIERAIESNRSKLTRQLVLDKPNLITFYTQNLPDVSELAHLKIQARPVETVGKMILPDSKPDVQKIGIEKMKRNPWYRRANAMLQFSQNYISKNWYQGGSDNTAILGVINGQFNYDNKKNLEWENFVEWRLGFNSVEGDTTRFLNTNDDVVRATSKLGLKAGGNWYYSANIDMSTHLFNSYRGINSKQMKATLLTPVRFNLGIGMDYKYQNKLSLYVSPLTYKFIYANDTINVSQNSFGIPTGENTLSQFGSSFILQNNIKPSREIDIVSKLNFYTNYEKVEVDWEVVGSFTVNRFLTTRVQLNTRYDNTVILAQGEKAKLQFKELLTFGLSYRFL